MNFSHINVSKHLFQLNSVLKKVLGIPEQQGGLGEQERFFVLSSSARNNKEEGGFWNVAKGHS